MLTPAGRRIVIEAETGAVIAEAAADAVVVVVAEAAMAGIAAAVVVVAVIVIEDLSSPRPAVLFQGDAFPNYYLIGGSSAVFACAGAPSLLQYMCFRKC